MLSFFGTQKIAASTTRIRYSSPATLKIPAPVYWMKSSSSSSSPPPPWRAKNVSIKLKNEEKKKNYKKSRGTQQQLPEKMAVKKK